MRWLLLAVVVGATVLTDVLQSREMKTAGREMGGAPGVRRVLHLILSRSSLMLSIGCMAISFFAFLGLLQIAPLSFAVPASAASFVIETILAKYALGETIAYRRAAGALLVLCGIVLVAR